MTSKIEIEKRINEIQQRIDLIEQAMATEREKLFDNRFNRLMEFLYKEKAVYSFAKTELEAIIGS